MQLALAFWSARDAPEQFFAPLELRSGLNVLDVGCGTGDFLRLLAPNVSPGTAVGLDLSKTMITEAIRRSASGFDNLSFRVGNALDLPFGPENFDRVLATQVLVHIPDPWTALGEMKRVLAPSGRLCIREIDWEESLVESSDEELGRRFSELACKELRNGAIVRELPDRLRDFGFDQVTVLSEVEVAQDLDAFYAWFVKPSLKHFTRIGAFSHAEADEFRRDLEERARNGDYFSRRTHCTIVAS